MNIRLIELAVPLLRPFRTATGAMEERRVVLVGSTDGDQTGWGEAAPYLGVTPDTIEGVWSSLVGDLALTPTAAAALEGAEADLAARLDGRPLWSSIGGSWRPLPSSLAIGLGDDAAKRIEATGPSAVKLKIQPGTDVARVEAVRRRYPDLTIGVDANAAYAWDDRDPLLALDRFDVAYIEQPFSVDDLGSHAGLRRELLADVVVDEAVGSVHDAVGVIEADAADVLAVKPGRLGLEGCRVVHDVALAAGLRVKSSGLLETAVGRAHTLAVALLPAAVYSDLADDSWFFGDSASSLPWPVAEGWVSAPELPGIGIDPDLDALAPLIVREETVTRSADQDRG